MPTLLLKASTLLLKYIVHGSPLELVLAHCAGRLVYGVRVFDDATKPATIWSVAEHKAELDALLALAQKKECPLFLFNELTLNSAWNDVYVDFGADAPAWIATAEIGPVDHATMKDEVHRLIDGLPGSARCSPELVLSRLRLLHEWRETVNHYITNQATVSPVHLFNSDEGGQQENLAVWITDSLQLSGVNHSPQVPKGKGRRELTDLLLSYEFGTVLIESKTLTIFNRTSLPSRDSLAAGVSKHIDKAVAQLRGAVKTLKLGSTVFDKHGTPLNVERTQPIHSIVLVPEFDLIQDASKYGREFIASFMEKTGGYLHLLDLAELLRVVQAAQMISREGTSTTPMMAFDYYLIERAKKTLEAGTLVIEVLLRIVDSEADEPKDRVPAPQLKR